jgi:2-keto-4-pentenoate hydratase/2-oxohepta-3-ene-1,7-dioic acid hydratase in catechol pathway
MSSERLLAPLPAIADGFAHAHERGPCMRFLTYARDGSPGRAGLQVESAVVDAAECAREASLDVDLDWASVKAIIADADAGALEQLETVARSEVASSGIPLAELTLLPPIPDPEKVLCIGVNYRDHLDEAQAVQPEIGSQPDPIVFSKFNSALIGDGESIVIPQAAPDMIDWEGELAVVIGSRCSRVARADAMDHVAGYTVINDVSARDVQLASPQWLMGKSFDTSGPCGPWIVTKDEVPDPQDLSLTTTVNGEVMQQTTTALMINPIARLIEYISSLITLVPGDIIATGTPAGVGYARDPKVFLAPGDTVKVSIEGVGELTNPVRQG